MTVLAEYGWTWLEITVFGLTWDGLFTVFGIWGVWDKKIWGLGGFKTSPAQAGFLV